MVYKKIRFHRWKLGMVSFFLMSLCLIKPVQAQIGLSAYPFSPLRHIGIITSQTRTIGAEFRFNFEYIEDRLEIRDKSLRMWPELLGFCRVINEEDFKLYTGSGIITHLTWTNDSEKAFHLSNFFVFFPLGTEFFPSQRGRLSSLGFGFEMSPVVQFDRRPFRLPLYYEVSFRSLVKVVYYLPQND